METQVVEHFRPRRHGPEALIEDHVAEHLGAVCARQGTSSWAARSVPVGAGMPDLLVVSYEPTVLALASVKIRDTHILAYLRAVTRARMHTIAERMHVPERHVARSLYRLVDAQAVSVTDDLVSLAPEYRHPLPEILAVEVKVSNWQRALEQAKRNRLFCHRSFVALPTDVAARVRQQPWFRQFGIGLLAVDSEGHVSVMRRTRRATPSVWTYYYYVACLVARNRGPRAAV